MRNRMLTLTLASSMLVFGAVQASAQLLPIMLLDAWAKQEAKKARAIPEHVAWCIKHHPGFHPQWNNYNDKQGIMRYCASPYYTPPWQVPYAKR